MCVNFYVSFCKFRADYVEADGKNQFNIIICSQHIVALPAYSDSYTWEI